MGRAVVLCGQTGKPVPGNRPTPGQACHAESHKPREQTTVAYYSNTPLFCGIWFPANDKEKAPFTAVVLDDLSSLSAAHEALAAGVLRLVYVHDIIICGAYKLL